jgi:hypothetical protein
MMLIGAAAEKRKSIDILQAFPGLDSGLRCSPSNSPKSSVILARWSESHAQAGKYAMILLFFARERIKFLH